MTILIAAWVFGHIAELIKLPAAVGQVLAGVGEAAYATVDRTINSVTKGVLGPVFFAPIGLTVDLSAKVEVPIFLAALLVAAMAGKLIGCGLSAYWINGHKPRDAITIGIGMSGRGAVELFIVAIAHEAGL